MPHCWKSHVTGHFVFQISTNATSTMVDAAASQNVLTQKEAMSATAILVGLSSQKTVQVGFTYQKEKLETCLMMFIATITHVSVSTPFHPQVSEVNSSTLNCRRVHCVKKGFKTNPEKKCKK